MARQRPSYPTRTPEQDAKIWQLVGELRESQANATAILNKTIDVQVALWREQGASEGDIALILDRKSRNAYLVDMLTRITDLDRFRKWAGFGVR